MIGSGERGQSAPLGVALLFGITILGATAVVAFGGAALTDTQSQSELARAEQSMTLFDSQAAQVALGSSQVQRIDFGRSDGTYDVDPSAGEISLIQLDCDDDDSFGGSLGGYDPVTDTLSADDYRFLSDSFGSVTYEASAGTLAYQGGGVWRKDASGGVGMVSPPEFHYRGATLTFPVVLTRGGGAVSGGASATVTQTGVTQVFAQPTVQYPLGCQNTVGTTEYLTNPVTNGTVVARIESEYARGWGAYFETRTSGDVRYYDNDGDGEKDDIVLIELISVGQVGNFQMPGDGGSVKITGAAGDHSTEEFKIRLRPDDTDSANFNNLQWSMYVDDGAQEFEIHVKKSGSGGCSGGSTGITADVIVYYSENDGDDYQGWRAADAFQAECADLNGDTNDEIYMDIEFVDDEDSDNDFTEVEGDDPELTYTSLSSSDLGHFNPNGDFTPSTAFSGHGDWESKTYSSASGDVESIDRLVNHYFAELPAEFDLTVDDENSDTVNEAGSSGELYTGAGGRYVTYLHVTTNEVEVEIEG